MTVRRDATFWTLATLGVVGMTIGVVGVVSPDRTLAMAGFETAADRAPGDHTVQILRNTSIAAISGGALYLLGTARRWPLFPTYVIAHRLLLGGGMAGLVAAGRAPRSLLRAAAWEAMGAATIGAALWSDRQRARRRRGDLHRRA